MKQLLTGRIARFRQRHHRMRGNGRIRAGTKTTKPTIAKSDRLMGVWKYDYRVQPGDVDLTQKASIITSGTISCMQRERMPTG